MTDEERFSTLDCYTSSYGTVLRSMGLDPVVLGDDWGYWFTPNEGAPRWPIERMDVVRQPARDVIAYWYGIEEHAPAHASTEEAWRCVEREVAAGRPVIVCVDTFYLPHSPLRNVMHSPHLLVVRGADGPVVSITDAMELSWHEGEVERDALWTAMSSPHLEGAPFGHRPNTTIALPDPPPGAGRELPADAVAERVADASRRFLEGDREDGRIVGERALRLFADELDAVASEGRPLSQYEFQEGLVFFAGLASRRRSNAEFLAMATSLLGVPELGGAAAAAERASDEWLVVRNGFYRALRKPAENVRKAAVRVRALGDAEAEMSRIALDALGAPSGRRGT